MKTTKGIVINFFEKGGGVTLRCTWFNGGKTIPIHSEDYTPQMLFNVVENLRAVRGGASKTLDDLYQES